MLFFAKLLVRVIAVVILCQFYGLVSATNEESAIQHGNKLLERSKRYLIYYRGGLFKIVIGYAMPIKLGTKQSLALALNLQWQYNVITNLTQAHKTYPPIIGRRSLLDANAPRKQYSDRQLAYLGIEAILDRQVSEYSNTVSIFLNLPTSVVTMAMFRNGFPGKQCLLKSICENAMNTLGHDGNAVIGQLFHIILTPDYNTKKPDVDSEFMDAKYAGHFGVDCSSLYTKCTVNTIDFLDMFKRSNYKFF